jgi:hypothetical protein
MGRLSQDVVPIALVSNLTLHAQEAHLLSQLLAHVKQDFQPLE